MKPFLSRAPLSPARARNCALMNQFATPGLGSLMARRFVAGAGQLGIFLAGCVLFIGAFVDEMRQYYSLMFTDDPPRLRYGLALAGVGLCVLAWLWALVTSVSLMREAKRNEREGKLCVQSGAEATAVQTLRE